MLAILKTANNDNIEERAKRFKDDSEFDIFITRTDEYEEIDQDGNRVIKTKNERINLTRKINETAKMIKQVNAEQRLKQLQEILDKGE